MYNHLPSVTIGITTFNRPEFLRAAVESVINQSFKDFELIISNDCLQVPVTWESLGLQFDFRINIINQPNNLGELENMNYLLREAKGKWFVWLADDDLLHPEFLSLALSTFKIDENSNLVAFYSNHSSGSDPNGNFPVVVKNPKSYIYKPEQFLLNYASHKVNLIGVYGLMRTNILRVVGGMPKLGNSFGPYSDTLLPMLLAGHGSIAWMNESLVFLRTHSASLSCTSSEISAFTSAEDQFLDYLDMIFASGVGCASRNLITAYMLKWFAHNEFTVWRRVSTLGSLGIFREFFSYQISYHLPRLPWRYKFSHLACCFRLILTDCLRHVNAILRGLTGLELHY